MPGNTAMHTILVPYTVSDKNENHVAYPQHMVIFE